MIGLQVGMSKSNLENAGLDRQWFCEIKLLNYVSAPSASNIIVIWCIKFGGRSNIAHPPKNTATIAVTYFQFILFFLLTLYGGYGQICFLGDAGLIWVKKYLYLFYYTRRFRSYSNLVHKTGNILHELHALT